jgi:replicative DNA helicase
MDKRNNTPLSIAEFPVPDTSQIEKRVLADIITSPEIITDARSVLTPEMFSDADCRNAYTTLLGMADKREDIDLVTASNRLGMDFVQGKLMDYICEAGGVIAPIEHLRVLREKYIRRKVYFSTIELLQAANSPEMTSEDLTAKAQAYMENLRESAGPRKGMQTLGEALNNLGEQIQEAQLARTSGHSVRTTTGFPMLDFLTYGGFNPGNLVILAARPSVGKTATMLQMARAAAGSGKVVNIFSLEMTNTELAQRLLLSTGRVQSLELARGQVEWPNFESAVGSIERMPMYLNDSAYSLDEIVSHITLNRQNRKCDIAFIDYLGLINSASNKPQYQILGEITHRLKATAKKLGIPVVLLCQLNRAIESANRPPALHDLRDSGDIEQDADIVLMLERPATAPDNRVNMYLRKNRQGQKDACIPLLPNDSYTNFVEIR